MAAMIRQRNKPDLHQQSPSSRGGSSAGYRSDSEREMTQIIIEEETDDDMMAHQFESYYTPQPPVMIPDIRYKDFMLGRTSKIKETSMLPDGPTCACRCIGFSSVAVAFLFWVGLLIDTQPIFIKGIQPKGDKAIEGVTFKVRTVDQRLPAAETAYHAGIAYILTILLCLAYRNNLFSHLSARIKRRQQYQKIPDGADRGSQVLPLYPKEAYANNSRRAECWYRFVMQIRNWTQRHRPVARNKRRQE